MRAASILSGGNTGSGEYSLSVYPASQPVNAAITANGTAAKLMNAGFERITGQLQRIYDSQ